MGTNIAIIGCGYVGMEVAALWSRKGYHVTATTRHAERLADLSKVAQKTQILKGDDEETLASLILANDVLIVTVAADSIDQYEHTYLHTAQLFRSLASEVNLSKGLIYTSSTSVYGDHHGRWVDESGPLLSRSEQSKILMEAEKIYLSLKDFGWHVCILRLAEIYGPGREISRRVQSMQGHKVPGTGEACTNMVHKKDIAAALDYALRYHLVGVYNLADDEHPTRKELYHAMAEKLHLPDVEWDPSLAGMHSDSKRVSNHKIKAEGFSFLHPLRVLD